MDMLRTRREGKEQQERKIRGKEKKRQRTLYREWQNDDCKRNDKMFNINGWREILANKHEEHF